MNYFIWNNIDSRTYGVIPETLPPPSRDPERVDKIIVPGRSGHLTISDDIYDGQIRVATCGILDRSLKDTVFAWLKGSGTVTFSNEPTRAYRARITDAIPMERINDVFHAFPVTFDCEPFAYEKTPTIHTLTGTTTITNTGTLSSLPIITVTGTGVLTVNGTALTITESGVTINSEIEECYAGTVNKNDKVSGGFPTLSVGANVITFGAGITGAVITGNYRWY